MFDITSDKYGTNHQIACIIAPFQLEYNPAVFLGKEKYPRLRPVGPGQLPRGLCFKFSKFKHKLHLFDFTWRNFNQISLIRKCLHICCHCGLLAFLKLSNCCYRVHTVRLLVKLLIIFFSSAGQFQRTAIYDATSY